MSKEKKQMVELRKEFFEDRENDMKENEALLQSMTSEQRKAIEGTIENLQDALLMITECNDLYLTQISKSDCSFTRLLNIVLIKLHESSHAMQSNFRVKQ